MPNQANFRSDVTTKTDPRYLASRIVNLPSDSIFLEDTAGSFGFDLEDNVEIHFYTIPGNQLILSGIVKLADNIVKSHTVKYADGTYKNYIQVDFTKFFEVNNTLLIPGDYRMVLNFFSDEIGSYINRKLTVTSISPSRTEVELSFNDGIDQAAIATNNTLLYEFVEKSFSRVDAVGVAEKIFKSGIVLNDPTEGITFDGLVQNINIPSINQTKENTVDRINRAGLMPTFESQVETFILDIFKYVVEEIVKGDERIQEPQFRDYVTKVVNARLQNLQATTNSRIIIS